MSDQSTKAEAVVESHDDQDQVAHVDRRQRVRFGFAEWIGLAALALTPASGFTWWGYQMSQRVTANEVRIEVAAKSIEGIADDLKAVIRLDERMKAIEHRLRSIEQRMAENDNS